MYVYNLQDFATKADYEGGLLDFIFGYGVDPEEIEDDTLRDLVRELYDTANPLIEKIDDLLPEPSDCWDS